jgi:hypothetical protein
MNELGPGRLLGPALLAVRPDVLLVAPHAPLGQGVRVATRLLDLGAPEHLTVGAVARTDPHVECVTC